MAKGRNHETPSKRPSQNLSHLSLSLPFVHFVPFELSRIRDLIFFWDLSRENGHWPDISASDL
jgi:hypothetical protein